MPQDMNGTGTATEGHEALRRMRIWSGNPGPERFDRSPTLLATPVIRHPR